MVQEMLGCGREEGGYSSEYVLIKYKLELGRVVLTCVICFVSCPKAYPADLVAQVSRFGSLSWNTAYASDPPGAASNSCLAKLRRMKASIWMIM